MTTLTELDALLVAPRETHRLEFKEAKTSFDQEKLCGYCVALANEGGGHLVLGVTDKPPRQVVGTAAFQNLQKTQGQLLDRLRFRVDLEEVGHPSGRVVILHVPARPRGTAYSLNGAYLMRSGDQLLAMTEDRLRSIFAEGKPDWLAERAKTNCSAEDVVELLDTQSYFELMKRPYPSVRAGVLERLEAEHLVQTVGGGWAITNLGAILFAKRLDQFDALGRRAPRVVVYDGNSKLKTKRDTQGVKGYAVGFLSLVEYVESQTPANEIIEQALRREVRMFPPVALRELLANALIHQDFLVGGATVMVEIYDNRVEISNPGEPPVAPDRFIDEYRSRNEQLANLMRRLGICEEKGSGIDKVIHHAEVYQLPAPEFRVDNVRTTATLFGHRSFATMTREERIRACYQHCALRFVLQERAGNKSLRARFGLPDDKAETVSRILGDTVEAGLIKPEDPASGSRKYARYLPYWA